MEEYYIGYIFVIILVTLVVIGVKSETTGSLKVKEIFASILVSAYFASIIRFFEVGFTKLTSWETPIDVIASFLFFPISVVIVIIVGIIIVNNWDEDIF